MKVTPFACLIGNVHGHRAHLVVAAVPDGLGQVQGHAGVFAGGPEEPVDLPLVKEDAHRLLVAVVPEPQGDFVPPFPELLAVANDTSGLRGPPAVLLSTTPFWLAACGRCAVA